jgi:hypothetical protein
MPNQAAADKPTAHPIAGEISQALKTLELAMTHVEEEDSVKAALAIGQAMGRLQGAVERILARRETS